jgi:uncharacterized protein YndB with AHSA1/START domain
MPSTKVKRTHSLRLKRTYAAPPEKLFKAWTDPLALRAWCAPSDKFSVPHAEVDLKHGGRFKIVMRSPDGEDRAASGIYSELRPPEKLVFTWGWEEGAGETLVIVEFRRKGPATELVLTHELFPAKAGMEEQLESWAGCLARLKRFIESRK